MSIGTSQARAIEGRMEFTHYSFSTKQFQPVLYWLSLVTACLYTIHYTNLCIGIFFTNTRV